jgi:hypothetical protein
MRHRLITVERGAAGLMDQLDGLGGVRERQRGAVRDDPDDPLLDPAAAAAILLT